MSAPIVPCFTSRYSIGQSLLSLEEPGKAKPGMARSVFDLANEANLKEVLLIEDRIDGFMEAYKSSLKAKVKLCYGLRFIVCADAADKTKESESTESRVTVMIPGGKPGYHDLVKLWNRAMIAGHYIGEREVKDRLDWKTLAALWTPNLLLGLPFFSSFIARNTLTMNKVVPDLSFADGQRIVLFQEAKSGLPFEGLLAQALDGYTRGAPPELVNELRSWIQPIKTVLYPTRADFKDFITRRAIDRKTTFDKPNVEHLGSPEFCYEAYKELAKTP